MNTVPEIKVCGMRNIQNITELITLKPDYMGFIFYPKSPRFIKEYPQVDMPRQTKKVGVFVNSSEREINDIKISYGLDYIQLHGDESPELCYVLKQLGAKIIKAFRIDKNFKFEQTRRYEEYVDYFLFDTAATSYGGSGIKFNWDLLRTYNNARPVFLSGGIGPDDASDILNINGLNLKAVDINSKFEREPGLKNINLLRKFFNELRGQQVELL